jgi:hypothetical protein
MGNVSARNLRTDLETAGITRAELFANDATQEWVTFYELRATGITWRAMRSDAAAAIMDVACLDSDVMRALRPREVA